MIDLVDWGFEDRLVRRIAVREAFAGLSQRNRRIVVACLRGDEQRRDIAKREGISAPRVSQIVTNSLRRVLARLHAYPPEPPRKLRPPAPFDRAAFLAHMRALVARKRSGEREDELARSREALHHALEKERYRRKLFEQQRQPPPPVPQLPMPPGPGLSFAPNGWQQPPPPTDPAVLARRAQLELQRKAEAEKDKLRAETQAFVTAIPGQGEPFPLAAMVQDCINDAAVRALKAFLAVRNPARAGNPLVGIKASHVTFAITDGIKADDCNIAVAVEMLNRGVPLGAWLSRKEIPIAAGTAGATAYCGEVALQVVVMREWRNTLYRLLVTWD